MDNKMNSDQLHPWATVVYHVDMYFKPGTAHSPVVATARMDMVDSLPVVNLLDVSVLHVGKGLAFTGDSNATMTPSFDDTTGIFLCF